jgi:hypothetical protein
MSSVASRWLSLGSVTTKPVADVISRHPQLAWCVWDAGQSCTLAKHGAVYPPRFTQDGTYRRPATTARAPCVAYGGRRSRADGGDVIFDLDLPSGHLLATACSGASAGLIGSWAIADRAETTPQCRTSASSRRSSRSASGTARTRDWLTDQGSSACEFR